MSTHREAQKAKTRSQILTACRKLFAQQGYEAASINEIAAAANISRASFFNYFPSKRAALLELVEAMDKHLAGLLVVKVASYGSIDVTTQTETAEAIARFFKNSGDSLLETANLNQKMLTEYGRLLADPDHRLQTTRRLRRATLQLLEFGQQRGEISTNLSLAFLADNIINQFIGVLLDWLANDHANLPQQLELTCQLILNNLQTTT